MCIYWVMFVCIVQYVAVCVNMWVQREYMYRCGIHVESVIYFEIWAIYRYVCVIYHFETICDTTWYYEYNMMYCIKYCGILCDVLCDTICVYYAHYTYCAICRYCANMCDILYVWMCGRYVTLRYLAPLHRLGRDFRPVRVPFTLSLSRSDIAGLLRCGGFNLS